MPWWLWAYIGLVLVWGICVLVTAMGILLGGKEPKQKGEII